MLKSGLKADWNQNFGLLIVIQCKRMLIVFLLSLKVYPEEKFSGEYTAHLAAIINQFIEAGASAHHTSHLADNLETWCVWISVQEYGWHSVPICSKLRLECDICEEKSLPLKKSLSLYNQEYQLKQTVWLQMSRNLYKLQSDVQMEILRLFILFKNYYI